MTSHKGSNGGHSCNFKKISSWSSSAGSLGKKMEEKTRKKKGKNGSGLFFKSQRFFKFIE